MDRKIIHNINDKIPCRKNASIFRFIAIYQVTKFASLYNILNANFFPFTVFFGIYEFIYFPIIIYQYVSVYINKYFVSKKSLAKNK